MSNLKKCFYCLGEFESKDMHMHRYTECTRSTHCNTCQKRIIYDRGTEAGWVLDSDNNPWSIRCKSCQEAKIKSEFDKRSVWDFL